MNTLGHQRIVKRNRAAIGADGDGSPDSGLHARLLVARRGANSIVADRGHRVCRSTRLRIAAPSARWKAFETADDAIIACRGRGCTSWLSSGIDSIRAGPTGRKMLVL